MTDLKTCPFCGHVDCSLDPTILTAAVWCPKCECLGPQCDLPKDAITAWNARAPVKVKPLEPVERRGYWQLGEYQIPIHTDNLQGTYRVRRGGKVLCRNIKGFDRAVEWVQRDHERRIREALDD